jgi:hypothetical protein
MIPEKAHDLVVDADVISLLHGIQKVAFRHEAVGHANGEATVP